MNITWGGIRLVAINVMFFLVVSFSIAVFFMLILTIKLSPRNARKLEIIGYGFLITLSTWTIILNLTAEMKADSDLLSLNEKLHIIWSYEGDKNDYVNNNDMNDLSQDYKRLHEQWHGLAFDDTLLKTQDEYVKYINYGLFSLSTLFISVGRLSELFKVKPEETISRKYPKYKRKRARTK